MKRLTQRTFDDGFSPGHEGHPLITTEWEWTDEDKKGHVRWTRLRASYADMVGVPPDDIQRKLRGITGATFTFSLPGDEERERAIAKAKRKPRTH